MVVEPEAVWRDPHDCESTAPTEKLVGKLARLHDPIHRANEVQGSWLSVEVYPSLTLAVRRHPNTFK
jgi:hypothetical protein